MSSNQREMPSDTRFPTSQSMETLSEGTHPTKMFIGLADGYSGYYATWEACRVKAFDTIHVATIEPAAAKILESIPDQVQTSGEFKATSKVRTFTVDAADPASVTAAARGMQVALIIPPASGNKKLATANMVKGVRDAGIKAIVLFSSLGADMEGCTKESFQVFGELERECMEHDVESVCIVRSAFFFQNLLLYTNTLRETSPYLSLPIGEGRFAPVDIQDVFGACIAIAHDVPHHAGNVYKLTGPQLVDGEDMAAACATLIGKGVEFKPCDPAEAEAVLQVKPGLDASEARYILDSYDLIKQGDFNFTTRTLQELLHKPPTDIQGFFRKHLVDLTDPQRAHLKAEGQ